MPIIIGGSGTANGITNFSSPATFQSTLTAQGNFTSASRGIATASMPSGSVIQVVQTVKTDTFSTTSTSFTDVTGMSASITPLSTSSRILIICRFTHGRDSSTTGLHFRLIRGGSAIFVGDASGSRDLAATGSHFLDNYSQIGETITYLDSPSTTSSTTYALQAKSITLRTIYLNRSGIDADRVEDARTASSIVLMEIA